MPFSPLAFMDATFNVARGLIDGSRRVVVAVDSISLAGGAVPVISSNADKIIGWEVEINNEVINSAHAAGALTIISGAVPAGKLWTVDTCNAVDSTSATTSALLYLSAGGITFPLNTLAALPAGTVQLPTVAGPWVLGPGSTVQVAFVGTALNDNCRIRVHGYQCDST